MARPTKLTPAVEERIARAIRAGNYPEVAARHAGVHPSTYYRWLERGGLDGEAPEDDPYRHFRAEVERALADSEAAEVGLIAQAARGGTWQAGAWLLERRFPDRWGRRQRVEQVHELKEGEATELEAEIERLLEEMAERERGPS